MTKQHLFQFLVSLLRLWDISVCLICKLNIFTPLCHIVHNELSEMLVIYLCYYQSKLIKGNHVCVFFHNTKHVYFQVISFVNSKDIQPSPIPKLCTMWHTVTKMFNLHPKQTEISQKRSKKIENCKRCYFIILSVLLNKTYLIFVS